MKKRTNKINDDQNEDAKEILINDLKNQSSVFDLPDEVMADEYIKNKEINNK